MNDTTKRKINSLRDVLVGKVPDPKSQVDQITNALIYKYMDDMDQEAISFGGKACFFVGDYEKYSWKSLMDPKKGAQERMNLYVEGLEKMGTNKNLSPIFRDILKEAYLPYRSPETLDLFLSEIDDFKYENSESLGDAFEQLLAIMGSQGDAGQFRTPRHIIDFIVEVVDPQKTDTILDPACGTAGFLISAYKHIIGKDKKKHKGASMVNDEMKNVHSNFSGYDIDPSMIKMSRVNLFLHQFPEPKIFEYDTISSEARWGDEFDVILANPPFMTPKGGIKRHKKFAIPANRSEVLFVDYIMEHLRIGGRAGVIVPEGIIFQSVTHYKNLRKMMIEEKYLYAVVSLPAGVFQPYSGVKTSILFFDKERAKNTEEILFVKIENDGLSLGAQRREIEKNNLPEAIEILQSWKKGVKQESLLAVWVDKKKIIEDGEYNLTGGNYREAIDYSDMKWKMVKLEEVLDYEQPTKYIVDSVNYKEEYKTPVLTAGKSFVLGYTNEKSGIFENNLPVIIFDDFTTANKFVDFSFKVKSSAMKILIAKKEKVNIKFAYFMMQKIDFSSSTHKRYWISQYSKIEIPLPPPDIQKEIVAELDSYQKIIDGARQVVKNYKPRIKIDSGWEVVKLGEVSKLITGGTPLTTNKKYYGGEIKWLVSGDINKGEIFDCEGRITKLALKESSAKLLPVNSVLIALNGQGKTRGTVAILRIVAACNQSLVSIDPDSEKLISEFLLYSLKSKYQEIRDINGDNQRGGLNMPIIRKIEIAIPSLKIQKQIVSQIEAEQKLVESNKKLIKIYEQKIKDKITEVWGEDK